jgi:xylulokinase
LRPCILWNDGRSAAECGVLERRWPALRKTTGNKAMPGFTAPKLMWVAKHEPEIFAATRLVLLPKAYLRLILTGEAIEDVSDASGSLWLDIARRDWSDEGLSATGLSRNQMPRLVEGCAPTARMRREMALPWGMTKQPVVAGGAGDNPAGAIGIGAIRSGTSFISLGTSGALLAPTNIIAANPVAGCAHVLSRRSQNVDARRCNSLGGIVPRLDRAAIVQAVLEGVAFALADCRDALADTGIVIKEADAIGGGSRSRFWLSVLANVLNIPIHRLADGETGAAFGAARLGRLAVTGEVVEAVCTPPRRIETFEPERALADAYAERLPEWRKLYRPRR